MQYVQISGGENISSSLKGLSYLIFYMGGMKYGQLFEMPEKLRKLAAETKKSRML